MSEKEIYDQLVALLRDNYYIDVKDGDNEKDLMELGLNSMVYIQLLVMAEQLFDVHFDVKDLSFGSFKSIHEVSKYIYDQKSQA